MPEVYYEHAYTVTNRVGRMVTKAELEGLRGFRSYFGFDPVSAAMFMENRRVKSTKGMNVFADELFIDIDNDEEAAKHCWEVLSGLGIMADVYFSGSKGYHFCIATLPAWSRDLPYCHLTFVKSLGIRCDECLYQSGRLFRLPGTVHGKTFRVKELVGRIEGDVVEIPIVKQPIRSCDVVRSDGSIQDFVRTLEMFMANPPANGTRNNRFWGLARSGFAGGFSEAFVEEALERVNDEMDDPLDDSEIAQVLRSAKGN
jgi:hypothetical protein